MKTAMKDAETLRAIADPGEAFHRGDGRGAIDLIRSKRKDSP